jgi:hypothetical protein
MAEREGLTRCARGFVPIRRCASDCPYPTLASASRLRCRVAALRHFGFAEVAEREGFEPPEPLRAHLISSQARSTTLPPLRVTPSLA